jgi:hypothetical protein
LRQKWSKTGFPNKWFWQKYLFEIFWIHSFSDRIFLEKKYSKNFGIVFWNFFGNFFGKMIFPTFSETKFFLKGKLFWKEKCFFLWKIFFWKTVHFLWKILFFEFF